nr:hypothetical protein CFP56_78973 [Quercus suber]
MVMPSCSGLPAELLLDYVLIDEHKDALDNAKSNYDKVKKTVDELRASEDDIVLENPMKKMLLMPVEP